MTRPSFSSWAVERSAVSRLAIDSAALDKSEAGAAGRGVERRMNAMETRRRTGLTKPRLDFEAFAFDLCSWCSFTVSLLRSASRVIPRIWPLSTVHGVPLPRGRERGERDQIIIYCIGVA